MQIRRVFIFSQYPRHLKSGKTYEDVFNPIVTKKNRPAYATAATFFAIMSSSARIGLLAGSLSIRLAATEGGAVPFTFGTKSVPKQ